MKKIIITLISVFAMVTSLKAAPDDSSRVLAARIDRSTDRLLVDMTIDADDLGKKSNRESWLFPVLQSESNSLSLPSVMVGGRNRYYQALRHGVEEPIYRGGIIDYNANVEWQPWMDNANLILRRKECGCCGSDTIVTDTYVATLDFVKPAFTAEFRHVKPAADSIKVRNIEGRAFIEFPVSSTEILPDYRSNPRELAVIRATIDSVRVDPDVTVREIMLKGFASPDGAYDNNVRLAKGRTEALKAYVQNLYHFPPAVIATGYVAEDWAGLREFVASSGLENRAAILGVIDSDLAPDAKERKLRSQFPEQYAFLLSQVYPSLRHTDYNINYTIRSYSDPAEILSLVYSNPSKLSLNEFFLAAQNVTQGGEDYNYIFETAARIYPDDETANLNAAGAALQQGSLENATTYLKKAGDSPDAIYTRGLLQAYSGEYEEAKSLLTRAKDLGVGAAGDALQKIEAIETYSPVIIIKK